MISTTCALMLWAVNAAAWIPQIEGSYGGHAGSAEVAADSVFRVSNNVHLLAQHTLMIAVRDSTHYGKVAVGEYLAVGGTLQVRIESAWIPQIGDELELLSAKAGLWGKFHRLDLPELPADRQWQITYDQESPRVDLDHDGVYDITLRVVARPSKPTVSKRPIAATPPRCRGKLFGRR